MGSVLVLDEVVSDGVKTGHVAIVVKVKQDPNNPDKYILTIRDANVAGRSEVLKSIIDKRDITFDRTRMECTDKKIPGDQHVAGFIHEKKTVYDEKKEEAQKLISNAYKDLLHRLIDEDGKQFYGDMLLNGGTIKDVENSIKTSDEYRLKTHLIRLADVRAKAIKASKEAEEAEKSIFRQTIEGLPEAAKNVFSMLPADASTTFYDASENAITAAQDQTTEGVDNNPTFTSGGNYWGHIALMLTKSGALEDVYSTLGPTDIASSNISIPSYNSSRAMTMNGTSSPPQITALETSTGAGTVGIPVSIDMYE